MELETTPSRKRKPAAKTAAKTRQSKSEESLLPKGLEVVAITPPPPAERVRRTARFAAEGERHTRYTLPPTLESSSPVGYRTRMPLSRSEAETALSLLTLERPVVFEEDPLPTEQELFEECSLGILLSRQSTNFRGHRQITLDAADSKILASLLRELGETTGIEASPLDGASHSHIVLTRPYRTPFTLLLTLVGHIPVLSLFGVPYRALVKRFAHVDDIPTIGYLQPLHLGILADGMERAAVIASSGTRQAQIFLRPFAEPKKDAAERRVVRQIEKLAGLGPLDRAAGWRVGLAAQVGRVPAAMRPAIAPTLLRKLGANLMAFRSERILPGVNQDQHAPAVYQKPQHMDVPETLTEQAGRAAYNAFAHFTGIDRERGKELLLLDRIDALTPEGNVRLLALKDELNRVMDQVIARLPKWADVPTGGMFTRGVNLGRKAFGLTGQRIYFAGLSRGEVAAAGIPWDLALAGAGAAAARSALYVELMGCVDLPTDCDLLAGVCIMAGPVNQNDIGKHFYGDKDLLARTYPDRDPTSLLVWTLKAKTIADPIGNEEQLLNAARKGKIVDLRPGPHEVIALRTNGRLIPMRKHGNVVNQERAFSDQGNFVTDPNGRGIPGNAGTGTAVLTPIAPGDSGAVAGR